MRLHFNKSLAIAIGMACASAPARATFHLMQIEQVIVGVNGNTAAQAIQLRMRSTFQNFVSQARIRAWDASGAKPVLIVDMEQDVSNLASGDRILIATSCFVAATSPNAVPDFLMGNRIPDSYLAAGSLTFEDDFGGVYWRLSWGGAGYTGSNTGFLDNDANGNFGPPFAGALPSASVQSLRFTGVAGAFSSTNAADYAITTGAATFNNNARQSFTVGTLSPVIGDIDGDCNVDIADHARCAPCLTGPGNSTRPAACSTNNFTACDIQGDNDVDLLDFAEFTILLTQP
jgi:hypothetical protein